MAARSLDMCTTVSCGTDVLCLDALLYSLRRFGDVQALNLLVSVNSSEPECEGLLRNTCTAYGIRSLYADVFPRKTGDPAWQHGESLNRLVGRTTTDHVFFMDPDIILTSPKLWPWCLENIGGRFMAGTPYHDAQARVVWQGTFPNIWFAVVDGPALRRSGLDMRPGSRHLCPDDWMPGDGLCERWVSVAGREDPPPEWALRGSPGGSLRDTSWELAGHACKHGLGHQRLEFFAGGGSRKNRGRGLARSIERWGLRCLSGEAALECASVARTLREISPLEFRLPGGEVCCLHLLHATTKPDRARAWLGVAKRIVDLCGQMTSTV